MSESVRRLASGKFWHMASAHERAQLHATRCASCAQCAVRSAHPGPTPALFSTKKSTAARSRASSPKSTTAFILLTETMTAAAGDVTDARERRLRCASPRVLARGRVAAAAAAARAHAFLPNALRLAPNTTLALLHGAAAPSMSSHISHRVYTTPHCEAFCFVPQYVRAPMAIMAGRSLSGTLDDIVEGERQEKRMKQIVREHDKFSSCGMHAWPLKAD